MISVSIDQVLVLRELAINSPTFFFQQVQQFFDCIFNALRDPKVWIKLMKVINFVYANWKLIYLILSISYMAFFSFSWITKGRYNGE